MLLAKRSTNVLTKATGVAMIWHDVETCRQLLASWRAWRWRVLSAGFGIYGCTHQTSRVRSVTPNWLPCFAYPRADPLISISPPFRRVITLSSSDGQVMSRVCDNVHEFSVKLLHDGVCITDVSAEAVRYPWTTCPLGTDRLKRLIGTPIKNHERVKVDQSQQCTHMLDLAKLALAHSVREGDRRYAAYIEADANPNACLATLSRDGEELFKWKVEDDIVVSPPLYAGHVTTGRAVWAPGIDADADLREAALVLRRCLLVFRGRRFVTPDTFRANAAPELIGVCVSFLPENVNDAVRPINFRDVEPTARD